MSILIILEQDGQFFNTLTMPTTYVCLLSHCVIDVAEMLYSIEIEASSAGLYINNKKSMHIVNSPLNSSLIMEAKYAWMVEVMQKWIAELRKLKVRLEC